MCGLAGILDLTGNSPAPERVELMCRALAHRGPDGQGVSALGPLVLGHRRLAIIDLSERGAQPLSLPEQGLTISYNGEVYNYLELRGELEQGGVRFQSDTDTEVVLQAYARWGLDCFERFVGMWALAIWDGPRRRLVLSRDRFGVKPLYLHDDGRELCFASEQKALLLVAPAARAPDEGVLGRFLRDGVQDEGERTFFRGVRQLSPGTTLVVEAEGGRREQRRYWSYDRERARASYDFRDPPATLRRLLEDAVRLRLRSDVPVGTCLSGGLDSSCVVALVASQVPLPVRTFTASFSDPGYDERRYARAVVERFGCQAREIEPRPGRDLVALLDRIGWYHDEPCLRPGLVTQWYVMQSAAGQVKVLLDGQGGDELLLGYAAYALPYLRSLSRAAWGRPGAWDLRLKLLRDGRGLLAQPSTSSAGAGTLAGHLVRSGLRRLTRRGRPPALAPELERAAGELLAELGSGGLPQGTAGIDRLLHDDLTRLSIPALLHHEDRASMAFSIEARVPFLDHRLVEFALALDFTAKVEGPLMKSVLRRALADLLPGEVLRRADKLGFPTPIGRWLREAAPEVKEVLLGGFAARGLVAPAAVERGWRAVEQGGGEPWLVYRWLTAELWLQRSIESPPVTRAPLAPAGAAAG